MQEGCTWLLMGPCCPFVSKLSASSPRSCDMTWISLLSWLFNVAGPNTLKYSHWLPYPDFIFFTYPYPKIISLYFYLIFVSLIIYKLHKVREIILPCSFMPFSTSTGARQVSASCTEWVHFFRKARILRQKGRERLRLLWQLTLTRTHCFVTHSPSQDSAHHDLKTSH